MLIDRGPAGRAAKVRLFDETSSALRFPSGMAVSEAEILNHLSSTEAQYRKGRPILISGDAGQSAVIRADHQCDCQKGS